MIRSEVLHIFQSWQKFTLKARQSLRMDLATVQKDLDELCIELNIDEDTQAEAWQLLAQFGGVEVRHQRAQANVHQGFPFPFLASGSCLLRIQEGQRHKFCFSISIVKSEEAAVRITFLLQPSLLEGSLLSLNPFTPSCPLWD